MKRAIAFPSRRGQMRGRQEVLMPYTRAASSILVGVLVLITPVLAQKKEIPSSRFVTYRGSDLEIRFPDNWIVTKTGNTVTLSPEEGNVSGALAYGLLMDIFEPRSRNDPNEGSLPETGDPRQMTLSDATDRLIEDLRRTHPNLKVVRSVQKDLGGVAAIEVEMNNASPVGGLEVDRLIAIRRPNEDLRYFLAVAPQAELDRYNSIFNRMISSIRFYN
jgi:hypothetical protein